MTLESIKKVFYDFKGEFNRIVWPSRETLIKHTVTVIVVSLLFGAYIALNDGVFGVIYNWFVRAFVPLPPGF